MNPDLGRLLDYPFERLARLIAGVAPPAGLAPRVMTVGEPREDPPEFVLAAIREAMAQFGRYPTTPGTLELRGACAAWAERRFGLAAGALDPERHVLPVAGTREALFAIAQVAVDRGRPRAVVALPVPGYQIYEGAAFLAGVEPLYLPCRPETGFLPDFGAVPAAVWSRCQLLYTCSPGNPTGAVIPLAVMRRLLELADRHGFVIAADECYSEIYADEAAPPPGFLQACRETGRDDFRRVIVFHSLSKRSNLPGLRSGFVAGDAELLAKFRRYRTYQGCALPLPAQAGSIAAWNDEDHVRRNRERYRDKFAAFLQQLDGALDVAAPPASFYLWPVVPGGDEAFARGLFAAACVKVLPGSYLSRPVAGADPGAGRVRMSLVESVGDCRDAAARIRDYVRGRCS